MHKAHVFERCLRKKVIGNRDCMLIGLYFLLLALFSMTISSKISSVTLLHLLGKLIQNLFYATLALSDEQIET